MAEQDQEVHDEVPEVSELEQRALEMGWRPKEEFDGPEELFVDAKEFIGRKPLYDRIAEGSKEIKKMREAISALQEHHAKVEEATRKQIIAELKAQKKEALEEGNADLVVEIDDQIAQQRAKEIAEAQKPVQQSQELHPAFINWARDNKWYENDMELRIEADALGFAYKQRNPGAGADDVLKEVGTKIRKLYPEKFANPRRQQESKVDGASSAKTSKKETFELTEDERKVMNTLVRAKVFTEDEYIAEVKKTRGV